MQPMTTHRRYTADEREQYLRLWQQSGQTQVAFCEQHDISPKTFGNWVRKSQPDKVKLLPVLQSKAGNEPSRRMMLDLVFPSGVRCQIKNASAQDVVKLVWEYEQCN